MVPGTSLSRRCDQARGGGAGSVFNNGQANNVPLTIKVLMRLFSVSENLKRIFGHIRHPRTGVLFTDLAHWY